MYLIFRPYTPPWALTYLKYAFAPGPTVPNADALPLRGTVPPIRICFEVTPGVPPETPPAGRARAAAARPVSATNLTATPACAGSAGSGARGRAQCGRRAASAG